MKNKNPKILLIAQHFYPEMVSTGLHMTELTTKWKELYPKSAITVFTSNSTKKGLKEELISKQEYKGVEIIRVKSIGKQHGNILNRLIYSLGFILKTLVYLLKNVKKHDVFLITTNPPFLGILILVIHKLFKKPYVIISYDVYPQILNSLNILKEKSLIYKLWYKLNTLVYLNASKVVSIGNDMTDILLTQIGTENRSKIELIHNWSDKDVVKHIDPKKNEFMLKHKLVDKKIILYSGTLGSTHNVEDILIASQDLKDHSDILFLFIGGGAKEKIVYNFIKENNSENLILLPFQPFEILSQTLSSATISVVCLDDKFTGLSVPSKTYGLMAARKPVLALMHEESEIAKAISKYQFGKIWNKTSKKKLSELILDMLHDQSILDKMADNGYNIFLDLYEIQISVKKYNNLVNTIISKDD